MWTCLQDVFQGGASEYAFKFSPLQNVGKQPFWSNLFVELWTSLTASHKQEAKEGLVIRGTSVNVQQTDHHVAQYQAFH